MEIEPRTRRALYMAGALFLIIGLLSLVACVSINIHGDGHNEEMDINYRKIFNRKYGHGEGNQPKPPTRSIEYDESGESYTGTEPGIDT